MSDRKVKCLTWNIEWATAKSARGKRIKQIVQEIDPDVICYTEATMAMLPSNGHLITSNTDYGYPNKGDRRKVLLWSKEPWQQVDVVGSADLPGGRFVASITYGIRFVGVCIPWRDAHVRTGRKDRALWQDHLQYLDAFAALVRTYRNNRIPVCVTGDFNQRIPRSRQPLKVARHLMQIFAEDWHIVTAGLADEQGQQLIDHVATCGSLSARVDQILPKRSSTGQPLSDHVGIVTSLTR